MRSIRNMKKTQKRMLSLLFMLLFLLSGCYSVPEQASGGGRAEAGPEKSADTGAVADTQSGASDVFQAKGAFHADNLLLAQRGISVFPTESGFFFSGSARFYDLSQKTAFTLCNVPGCLHNSESCPAYFSGVLALMEHEGRLFVFCEAGSGLILVCADLKTGERRTLESWQPVALGDSVVLSGTPFYSTGRLYFKLGTFAGDHYSEQCFLCDLPEGVLRKFGGENEREGFDFLGAYGERAVVAWSIRDEDPQRFDEFLSQRPELDPKSHPDADPDSAYSAYLDDFQRQHVKGELRLYDLKSGGYEPLLPILADGSENAPNVFFSSGGSCYGRYLLYTLGDYDGAETICRYDLEHGTVERLVDGSHFLNGFLYDDRLIYLEKDEKQELHVCVYDPETKENRELDNAGETQIMAFSIHAETADAFIGMYQGRDMWITKADFYAGRFENAVSY